MSREVPPLNEMLKLYSKKELWDRIQEKNRLLDQRNQQIAELQQRIVNQSHLLKESGYNRLVDAEIKIKAQREELEAKEKAIKKYKTELKKKDKNALALYSALYEVLEKQNPENVASQIDYLTKQDNGEINDIYKEYKMLKAQLTENIKLKNKLLNQPREIVEKVKSELFNNAICITGTGVNAVRLYAINKVLDEILKDYEEKGDERD